MVSGSMKCIKNLLFIFNLLFFLAGLGLILIGVLVQTEYQDYLAFFDSQINAAALFVIGVGSVLFIVGFFGCCGAYKENGCMVIIFALLVGVLFLLEIATAIAALFMRNEVDRLVRIKMTEATGNYQKQGVRQAWDETQRELKCCGANNYTDWLLNDEMRNRSSVPFSCCINVTKVDCSVDVLDTHVTTDINVDGCANKLLDWVGDNVAILGGVGVGLALVQAMGIFLAILLARAIQREYNTTD